MANRIHDFRIVECPEELYDIVDERLGHLIFECFLRAETVRRQYWEDFGHLIDSGRLIVKFADDFSDLDD